MFRSLALLLREQAEIRVGEGPPLQAAQTGFQLARTNGTFILFVFGRHIRVKKTAYSGH